MRRRLRRARPTEAGAGFTPGLGSIAAARFNPFDIWIEGKYTNFRDNSVINSASNSMDGQFGLISVGADYVLNRWLLVGVHGAVRYHDPDLAHAGNRG